MTERLFIDNVYLTDCTSTIVEIPKPGHLVLDRTIFFPAGGGQPGDQGTIDEIKVVDVFEKDGQIIHRLEDEGATAGAELSEGASVRCQLDWDRRFDHMQRHCGEHILSGIFFRDHGGVNRGFHMGEDYMTIDIDLPSVSPAMLSSVELEANKVVWSNAPVTIRRYGSREETENLPLRKAVTVDDDISVVCVGDEAHPADCVACCGTHPDSAGQVGLIKILKSESNKGMSRIYFEAGKRALLLCASDHALVSRLMEKYSADEKTLLDKMKAQDEKNDAARQELYRCKELLLQKEAVSLLDSIAVPGEDATASAQLVVREYDNLPAADLQELAKKISAASADLFMLVSIPENTIVLCTGNAAPAGVFDCGRLVRDHAASVGGKGGGNAAMARVAFGSQESLYNFIDRVIELL